MADVIDDRIVRISFEINGQLKIFDGLFISATGTKFANPIQNECEVKIANLSKEDRDYLVTECSPFNKNKTPKKMILEAGRVSTGTSKVYEGDILTVTPSQPPDIMLTLKSKTGQFAKGNVVSSTAPPSESLQAKSQKVADQMGLSLQFEAKDKNISNGSYSGAQLKMVNDLGETGGVNSYIDDGKLVVKDFNVPLNGQLRIVDENTGMIGIPEIDEHGVKVKMLFDNKTVCGGALRITSKINVAVNGDYCIYKLSFDIANRDTPFYLIAEAKRLDS